MGHNEPIRKSAQRSGGPSSEIPDKLYFRIGEVARICEVPAYVLRFWETEFPQLRPNKGGTGQRLYRRRDVEMAMRVKSLLYDEGYTIPGARQVFHGELKQKDPQLPLIGVELPAAKQIYAMRRELEAIVAMLSHPPGTLPGAQTIHPIRGGRRVDSEATAASTSPALVRSSGLAPTAEQTSEIPYEPASDPTDVEGNRE